MARNLARDFPPLFWFRNGHWFRGEELCADLFIALGDGIGPLSNVNVTVNATSADIDYQHPQDNWESAFWYLPRSHRTRAVISCRTPDLPEPSHGAAASDYFEMRLEVAGPVTMPGWARTFCAARNLEAFRSTPPVENIRRVSGKQATAYSYWNNGRTDFTRFSALAMEHGVDVRNPAVRILDWGCGCGRLTRHWLALPHGEDRVFGADIDPVNLKWCKEHLSEKQFLSAPLYPPTDFPGPFSLIVGNSVLTHLRCEALRAWLAHIADLLAPRGLALLSFHGDFSLASYHSRYPALYRRIKEAGFDSTVGSDDLGDAIADQSYYRQTFMTDEFAAHLFGEFFDYRGRYVGVVSRYQNIAVLRRK